MELYEINGMKKGGQKWQMNDGKRENRAIRPHSPSKEEFAHFWALPKPVKWTSEKDDQAKTVEHSPEFKLKWWGECTSNGQKSSGPWKRKSRIRNLKSKRTCCAAYWWTKNRVKSMRKGAMMWDKNQKFRMIIQTWKVPVKGKHDK